MPQFYTLLTDVGQNKLANAVALGTTIEITELAVGDGGGSLPTPDSSATSLVNEVRRAAINTSDTDPDNPSWIVVEQVLPPDVGGWTIREIGIYDVDGDLIGIGNYPETYKPVLAEGSSRTQTVRFVLEVSDTSAVTLKVDPSVVLATREYVDQERAEHEASRSHPLANTTERGMVEKATTTEAKDGTPDKFPDAAGVIAALQQYGLGKAIRIGRAVDLNDITKEGIYGWSGGAPVNSPENVTYGVMLVIDDGQLNQIVLGGSTVSQLYQRRANSGTWSSTWSKFLSNQNGGSGSGFDADMLDGLEATFFRDASNLNAGTVPVGRLPTATEAAIGAAEVATQPETDDGADDTKFVTPKKLKAWVKQATETVMGLMKVATQTQVDAGTDDTTAVTPKKLRWGVSYSLQVSGYVAMPSWLGGLIIQWGRQTIDGGATTDISLPISFPNEGLVGVPVDGGTASSFVSMVSFPSVSTIRVEEGSGSTTVIYYIAVGY